MGTQWSEGGGGGRGHTGPGTCGGRQSRVWVLGVGFEEGSRIGWALGDACLWSGDVGYGPSGHRCPVTPAVAVQITAHHSTSHMTAPRGAPRPGEADAFGQDPRMSGFGGGGGAPCSLLGMFCRLRWGVTLLGGRRVGEAMCAPWLCHKCRWPPLFPDDRGPSAHFAIATPPQALYCAALRATGVAAPSQVVLPPFGAPLPPFLSQKRSDPKAQRASGRSPSDAPALTRRPRSEGVGGRGNGRWRCLTRCGVGGGGGSRRPLVLSQPPTPVPVRPPAPRPPRATRPTSHRMSGCVWGGGACSLLGISLGVHSFRRPASGGGDVCPGPADGMPPGHAVPLGPSCVGGDAGVRSNPSSVGNAMKEVIDGTSAPCAPTQELLRRPLPRGRGMQPCWSDVGEPPRPPLVGRNASSWTGVGWSWGPNMSFLQRFSDGAPPAALPPLPEGARK